MELEGTRQRQKRQTRAAILRAALAVFLDGGFRAGSTEEIARLAGVAHGTMFVHFPTREDLLVAAVEAAAGSAAAETRQSLQGARSVKAVLRAHLAVIARDEDLFAHLARESFALPARARAVVIDINSAVSQHLGANAFVFNLWLGLLNHRLQNRDLFPPLGPELADQFVKTLHLEGDRA
jgi:AcrR family transcriptional regulator